MAQVTTENPHTDSYDLIVQERYGDEGGAAAMLISVGEKFPLPLHVPAADACAQSNPKTATAATVVTCLMCISFS